MKNFELSSFGILDKWELDKYQLYSNKILNKYNIRVKLGIVEYGNVKSVIDKYYSTNGEEIKYITKYLEKCIKNKYPNMILKYREKTENTNFFRPKQYIVVDPEDKLYISSKRKQQILSFIDDYYINKKYINKELKFLENYPIFLKDENNFYYRIDKNLIEEDINWEEEEKHYQEVMSEKYIEPNFEYQVYDFEGFDGYDCNLEMKQEYGVLVRK